jgi:hypothetical protein
MVKTMLHKNNTIEKSACKVASDLYTVNSNFNQKGTIMKKSASLSALAAARADLKNARIIVATLKEKVAALRDAERDAKIAARAEKSAARDAKRAAAIEKAKARLERLMNPVGHKAQKAAKKPGPVTVTKFNKETREAAEIAANLVAKRKTA